MNGAALLLFFHSTPVRRDGVFSQVVLGRLYHVLPSLLVSLCSPANCRFSPAQTPLNLTPPSPPQGLALYPCEHRLKWSFQACSFLLLRSSLDQSKRARVKEHRLLKIRLSGVPPSASTRTDQADPSLLVCAFGEQEKSAALVALPLVWSSRSSEQRDTVSAIQLFHPSLEQRRPSTSSPLFFLIGDPIDHARFIVRD